MVVRVYVTSKRIYYDGDTDIEFLWMFYRCDEQYGIQTKWAGWNQLMVF